MNADDYRRLSAAARSRDGGVRLRAVDRICVAAVALSYALALVWLAVAGDARLATVFLAPATGFVVLSLVRRALNRPRPYEVLDIEPLLDASTKGSSFPSRHVSSGALIAVALACVEPLWGIGVGVLTALLAWVRVKGGVHWPADVLAGLGAGALWAVAALALCAQCGLAL